MDHVLSHVDWTTAPQLPTDRPTHSAFDSPYNALSLVIPGLFLTAEKTAADRGLMLIMGVRLVIKMNAESLEPPYQVYEYDDELQQQVHHALDQDTFYQRLWEELQGLDPDRAMAAQYVFVRAIRAEDSPTYDIAQHFLDVVSLIELVIARRHILETQFAEPVKAGTVVLPAAAVHCLAGVSRSSTVVIAYLMKRHGFSREQATQYVKEARPIISPNTGFCAQLTLWENCNGNRITDYRSAKQTAVEMLRGTVSARSLMERLKAQFSVMCSTSRLHDDRRLVGLLLRAISTEAAQGIASPSAIVHTLLHVALEGIDDEIYIDSPDFLRCFVGITASLKLYAPRILVADPDADESGVSTAVSEGTGLHGNEQTTPTPQSIVLGAEDAIHATVLHHIRLLPHADPANTVELLARYLKAITALQLDLRVAQETPAPSAVVGPIVYFKADPVSSTSAAAAVPLPPLVVTTDSSELSEQTEKQTGNAMRYARVPADVPIVTTVCVLPSFARLADGFIAWGTLQDIAPSEVVGGPTVRVTVVGALRKELAEKFLLVRWDGAVGAVGTSHLKRWESSLATDPHGYLFPIKRDIEVVTFEALEAELADLSTSPHLSRRSCYTRIVDCLTELYRLHVEPTIASLSQSSFHPDWTLYLVTLLKRKMTSGLVALNELQSCIVRYVFDHVTAVEMPSPSDRGGTSPTMMFRSCSSNNGSFQDSAGPPALVSVASGCGVVLPLTNLSVPPAVGSVTSPIKKALQYSPMPSSMSRRAGDRSPSMSYSSSEPPTPVRASNEAFLHEEASQPDLLGEADVAALWEPVYALTRRCERALLLHLDELFSATEKQLFDATGNKPLDAPSFAEELRS